jgi:hypothetical protein
LEMKLIFQFLLKFAICLMQKQGQDFRGDPDKTTRVDHLM